MITEEPHRCLGYKSAFLSHVVTRRVEMGKEEHARGRKTPLPPLNFGDLC